MTNFDIILGILSLVARVIGFFCAGFVMGLIIYWVTNLFKKIFK